MLWKRKKCNITNGFNNQFLSSGKFMIQRGKADTEMVTI